MENNVAVLPVNQSRVNITWAGENVDLPDPVPTDATEADIRRIATESVRAGVPGLLADPGADFKDFVVDRFGPTDERPFSLIMLRPKTPFGGL